jgi:anti-sigma factor RsiW
MIDRNSPVTEDELHAHVDGELAADRRAAVEAWLASHPDDAARIAGWRMQAEAIRAAYGPIAQQPIPDRLKLDRLAWTRRSWAGIAAAAAVAAFLVGGAVGWMARGAAAAAPKALDSFAAEALAAHRLYVVEVRHPVEVPGAERPHLVQWLSKRVGYELRTPDLEPIGLKLVGGRLLPGPAGATAFFMYEGPTGERFTLYCGRSSAGPTAMRYHANGQAAGLYWNDDGIAYMVSGPAERERLQAVAQTVYDQVESRPPRKDPRS